MIQASEISDRASTLGLPPRLVERDYIAGWLLAGLSQTDGLRTHFTFTGGACLKKCFFETYRFSDELEFIVSDKRFCDPRRFIGEMRNATERAQKISGISFLDNDIPVELGVDNVEARVGYVGPLGKADSHITLRLTTASTLASRPIERLIINPYSDREKFAPRIICHSFEELFSEAIFSLCVRGEPEDLYDVITQFRAAETAIRGTDVRRLLRLKCVATCREFPKITTLDPRVAQLISKWGEALARQLPALPPADDYLSALPRFFRWLNGEFIELSPPTCPMPAGASAFSDKQACRLETHERKLVEQIRCAALLRLCVEIHYADEKSQPMAQIIAPYALRLSRDNNVLLCATSVPSEEIVSYALNRIRAVRITTRSYRPRYELLTVDPQETYGRAIFLASQSSEPRSVQSTAVYIYRCSKCEKQFARRVKQPLLPPHRDGFGRACDGRLGIYTPEQGAD